MKKPELRKKEIEEDKTKSAIAKLIRDYELAKKDEKVAKEELDKYERLYLAEKDLSEIKMRALESSKVKLENAKKEQESAEKDLLDEKRRIDSINEEEGRIKQKLQRDVEEEGKLKKEIKKLIEEQNRLSESKDRVSQLRNAYEESKKRFDSAQVRCSEQLRNILKEDAVNEFNAKVGKDKEIAELEMLSKELDDQPSDVDDEKPITAEDIELNKLNREIKVDEKLKQDLEKEELYAEEIKVDVESAKKKIQDLEKIEHDLENVEELKKEEDVEVKSDMIEKESIEEEEEIQDTNVKQEGKKKQGFFNALKRKIIQKHKEEKDVPKLNELEEKFKRLGEG